MKHLVKNLTTQAYRLDRQKIQLMIVVVTLMLFVLVGGAPDGGGGSCSGC
jgi:hypothetical protein